MLLDIGSYFILPPSYFILKIPEDSPRSGKKARGGVTQTPRAPYNRGRSASPRDTDGFTERVL